MIKELYCITGAAGSGKDTAGAYLATQLGVHTYALADPIKQLVSALFNKPVPFLNHRENKERKDFYVVTVDSLETAAAVYRELGLDKYQDFHDAWDTWQKELGLKIMPWGDMEAWYSPRDFFQYFGTEWGRKVCDTMWLELAPSGTVITDIRMKNEAEYFVHRGYTLLEIINPNLKPIDASGHSTESGEAAEAFFTTPVYNNGSIRDLHVTIDNLLQK